MSYIFGFITIEIGIQLNGVGLFIEFVWITWVPNQDPCGNMFV